MAQFQRQDGATFGRSDVITFDLPDYSLCQQPTWRDLLGKEIGSTDQGNQTQNVAYYSGIGWRLISKFEQLSYVHEQGALDAISYIPQNSNATIPIPILAEPVKRWNNDLTGVPQGSQVASGDFFLKKKVSANNADWSNTAYSNSADQTSYPGPFANDIVPLDRIVTANDTHYPDERVVFRAYIPQFGRGGSLGTIVKIYFSGLGEQIGANTTVGQYCVSLDGDGTAILWTKTSANAWLAAMRFRVSQNQNICGEWISLVIESDALFDTSHGTWTEHKIIIRGNTSPTELQAILSDINVIQNDPYASTYTIGAYNGIAPEGNQPVRLDVRRDIRANIFISKDIFVPTGTLQTAWVAFPTNMGPVGGVDEPIFVNAFGTIPNTASTTIALLARNDSTQAVTTATIISTGTSTAGTYTSFDRVRGASSYCAVITFNDSTDQMKSPVVDSVQFIRNGVVALPSQLPTPVVAARALEVTATSGQNDMTTDSASIRLEDLVGQMGILDTRCGQSVRVEASYLVSGTPTTSTIFQGKVVRARKTVIGRKNVTTYKQFPVSSWGVYQVDCAGMWRRFMQAKTLQTYRWDTDPLTSNPQVPWKITDIVRTLLGSMGMPPTMIDVPDDPMRLFADPNGGGANSIYRLEIYTEILPYLETLVSNYLGAFLIFDANATNGGGSSDKYGCVRMMRSPKGDVALYNVLANFVRDATYTQMSSKYDLRSYPSNVINGQTVPDVPTIANSLTYEVQPPEFNALVVSGSGAVAGLLQAGGSSLNASIYNYPAAYFYDAQPIKPNPANPDYTDGTANIALIVDPGLVTQQAVNFVARRTFDLAAHSVYYASFSAPLVLVTDHTDTLQIRPRPLRYGDAVTFDGQTWLIKGIQPEWSGDRGGANNMRANYDLFRVPELMNIGSLYTTVGMTYGGACGAAFGVMS